MVQANEHAPVMRLGSPFCVWMKFDVLACVDVCVCASAWVSTAACRTAFFDLAPFVPLRLLSTHQA